MKIDVQPYDPDWPMQFLGLATDLAAALRSVEIVGIEHIGSTSIPGLAAKPIIDIDVIVTYENVEPAIAALADAGHKPRGHLGIPDRYAFEAPDTLPRRNVYVILDSSLSLRNHLGVRDVLRNNNELRERYGALKVRLADRAYNNVEGYVADKSEVLQLILAEAGLTPNELATINELNNS